jgi:hypothetical protein
MLVLHPVVHPLAMMNLPAMMNTMMMMMHDLHSVQRCRSLNRLE